VPPPSDDVKALASTSNRNVVAAALRANGQEVDAALVRALPSGQQLWVSRTKTGAKAKYVRVTSSAGPLLGPFLRPAWLAVPQGALAVVAHGTFYVVTVTANGATAKPIQVQGPGTISAFSVGPDGHHVAFVSGGQVWIAVLSTAPTPYVTPAREINMPDLTGVTSVAWSSINQLVISGSAKGHAQVIEAYADGLANKAPYLSRNGYQGAVAITHLECFPLSPLAISASAVMVQTSDGGVFGGRANPAPLTWSVKDSAPVDPFFVD
jgi:hypothetical protein